MKDVNPLENQSYFQVSSSPVCWWWKVQILDAKLFPEIIIYHVLRKRL